MIYKTNVQANIVPNSETFKVISGKGKKRQGCLLLPLLFNILLEVLDSVVRGEKLERIGKEERKRPLFKVCITTQLTIEPHRGEEC